MGNCFSISYAETEPVLITVSDSIRSVNFDGKWTFFTEWKESSLDSIPGIGMLRSAHHDDFIYIFVDALYDSTLDGGSDRAIICFDPNNSKSAIPEEDDHCFVAILNEDMGYTMRGNPESITNDYFEKIPNHDDYVGIGGASDDNDRYLKTPHPSYEFRIPTDQISRSNHYGFYLETFDATSNQTLTWPLIAKENSTNIPGPQNWGDLISPDKSLPEFPLPILFLVVMLFSMIMLSKKLYNGNLTINIQ